MGEVYRADDLRLGESVALKFLPSEWASDTTARDRLLGEVRVTRQITHPNVCRVHDLVELEGEICIAMEYIDGEDLASLLRRIGRLPEDKGVEIARQVCAGLAAAHARGVLHRDLKPANVMLDGRGRVKINDFGIAALVEAGPASNEAAGTPLYMAPEVIRGEPATMASDVYALGLLCFEIFTGKRAIQGESISEIRRWHERGAAIDLSASSIIDPAIHRVLEQSLDPEPSSRPASANRVSAMLPGGDPLLEALAAGETPSPELVAAAGGSGQVTRQASSLLLAVILAALGLSVLLERQVRITEIAPMPEPPDALEFVAREMMKDLGHTEPPADVARGFLQRDGLIRFIELNDLSPDRWDRLSQPDAAAMRFWMRTSPAPLFSDHERGILTVKNPLQVVEEMSTIVIAAGSMRLLSFESVPARGEADLTALPPWEAVLEACGFREGNFEPIEATAFPRTRFDEIRAWKGTIDSLPGVDLTLQAAAWGRHITFVRVDESWPVTERREAGEVPGRRLLKAANWLDFLLLVIPLFAGAWFGISNLRNGRSDRAGAFRVAVIFVSLHMLVWLFRAHHVSNAQLEVGLLIRGLQTALFEATFAWVLYLAVEPTIRRHWPQKLVSWTRLVRGQGAGDSLVSRDLLIGLACGTTINLLMRAHWVFAAKFCQAAPTPLGIDVQALSTPRQTLGELLLLVNEAAFIALLASFMLVLLLILTRHRIAAWGLLFTIAIFRMPYETVTESLGVDLAMRALAATLFLIAVDRSMLSILAAVLSGSVMRSMTLGLHADSWMWPQALIAVGFLAGGAILCSWCAGRSDRSTGRSGTRTREGVEA